MNVHLVEDTGNCPGRIYAVFAHPEDAQRFSDALVADGIESTVVERHLWYGQPPVLGVNE
jgi:hypothetical protein